METIFRILLTKYPIGYKITIKVTVWILRIKGGLKVKLNQRGVELEMAQSCLSLNDLCKKTRIAKSYVSEGGGLERDLRPYQVGKIAKALGVDPEEIILQEGEQI